MAYAREKGKIRTDRGQLLDKGNWGVDPQHWDFNVERLEPENGADFRDCFARADTYAVSIGAVVAPSIAPYTIASNLTIASGLRLAKGVTIDGPAGASPKPVLTIDGPFYAGAHACFGANVSVRFKNVRRVLMEWFGGQSSTDAADAAANDAALAAALASLPAWPLDDANEPDAVYGGAVELQAKSCYPISAVPQVGSMQGIVGQGRDSILWQTDKTIGGIAVGDGSAPVYGVEIRNFTLKSTIVDGTRYVDAHGIYAQRFMRSRIENVWVWGFGDSGIKVYGSSYSYIERNYVQRCRGRGIEVV
ncbi:MAG TPA: right-handed parallel beta-helix repeat-containing protein, partial [Ramlibacter sp.]|nr:right-handed parallel beta-helix repeat-containing protein [Ramlibacter sp.]